MARVSKLVIDLPPSFFGFWKFLASFRVRPDFR